MAYSDTFNRQGFEVPALSEATMDFLRRSVPTAGSIAGNPLDMWRTFIDADYLAQVLELGYKDSAISIIVVDRLIPQNGLPLSGFSRSNAGDHRLFKKSISNVKPTVFTIDSDGGDPELADTGDTVKGPILPGPVFRHIHRPGGRPEPCATSTTTIHQGGFMSKDDRHAEFEINFIENDQIKA